MTHLASLDVARTAALVFSHNPNDFVDSLWVVAAFAVFPAAAIIVVIALVRYYRRMRGERSARDVRLREPGT